MLSVRDHGVEDYEALPHMDTTDVGDLREEDQACLEELGQYLVTTEAWERFGIWLLHKHFEPAPGEVFVEHTVREPRKTETTPVERSTFPQRALSTTAIRFDDATDNGVAVVGMEFAAQDDLAGAAPLGDGDEAVLSGIAERLRAHDKIGRFGVRLIRNPLELSDGEMLHETCDSTTRTMTCTVGQRDAMLADVATVQTAWRWRLVQGGTDTVVMQDCTAGCVRVGEGHDLAHNVSGTDDFDNPTEGGPDQPF